MGTWIWLGPLLGGLVIGLLFGLRPALIMGAVMLLIEFGIFLAAYLLRDYFVAWTALMALIAFPIYGGAMLLGALLGSHLRSHGSATVATGGDPNADAIKAG